MLDCNCMTNKEKQHGAMGSNAPLERVPVVEEEVPQESEVPGATSSATEKDDEEDVVYLREDLRRSGS